MRIALIRRNYKDFGGAERYVSALTQVLCDQGHEVHLFVESWNARQPGAVFHRIPLRRGPGFMKLLSFAAACSRLTKTHAFDIVHSFERTIHQDVYRAGDGCHREWLLQRARIEPWARRLSFRINPLHLSILYLEKRLFSYPGLKKVIANSQRGKEEIIRHYGVDPGKIRVIYNGFDPRLLDQPATDERISSDKPAVLFVGSGFERKGLGTAIQALALMRDSQATLVVVGRDRPGKFRRLAARLGVGNRVVFAGQQKYMGPFYGTARVFILPTLYEPFSNACVEAAAFGLPVVTTRINGFSEWIRQGENGYVLDDPLDPQAAADALQKALEMPRVTTPGLPTIEDNVRDMLSVYDEIRSPAP